MDALSVTLAVLSLATAVQDLVELAQNICDAFEKVWACIYLVSRTMNDIVILVNATGTPELQKSNEFGVGCLENFEENANIVRQE